MTDFTNDPFGRTNQLPAAATFITREHRTAAFGRVMQALLAEELPDPADAFFVGGAGMAYLEDGHARVGDLERKFLRMAPERGSHFTVAALWAGIKRRLHQQ